MNNILFRHGCPARIQMDRGSPYVSEAFRHFFQQWDIVHMVSAAYHPESNGMAERTISSIKSNLVKIRMNDWLSVLCCLGIAVAANKIAPSCAKGFLPFKLLYGREGIVPDEISHVGFSTVRDYNLAVENH